MFTWSSFWCTFDAIQNEPNWMHVGWVSIAFTWHYRWMLYTTLKNIYQLTRMMLEDCSEAFHTCTVGSWGYTSKLSIVAQQNHCGYFLPCCTTLLGHPLSFPTSLQGQNRLEKGMGKWAMQKKNGLVSDFCHWGSLAALVGTFHSRYKETLQQSVACHLLM